MEYLISTWFGSFLYDLSGLKEKRLVEKDPKKIAERLKAMKEGKILEDEKELAVGKVRVADVRLKTIGEYYPDDIFFTRIQPKPENFGYDISLIHSASVQLAVSETRLIIGTRDKHIMQGVSALDEMQRTANVLSERLFEWYGLHFPEFAEKVTFEELAHAVAEYGDRESVAGNIEKAKPLLEITSGGEIEEEEKKVLMDFARSAAELYNAIPRLQDYIERAMKEVAPNVAHIAGPILGARLIALAGGLEKLANMTSGTVQLLGAESALFRHLRQGSKPPKHGVLFQHPVINKAPKKERGKLARTYAGKISIAAKADAYSKEFIADKLMEKLEKRVKQIKQ